MSVTSSTRRLELHLLGVLRIVRAASGREARHDAARGPGGSGPGRRLAARTFEHFRFIDCLFQV